MSEVGAISLFPILFLLPQLKRHTVFYTSAIPEITWYEPLYNSMNSGNEGRSHFKLIFGSMLLIVPKNVLCGQVFFLAFLKGSIK